MGNLSLYHMTKEYEEAFLTLIDADIPPEALNDTLQALEGEIAVKGSNVAAFILNLEAEAEKIKGVEQRIAARRKAYENKAQRIRAYLKENMERLGIKKIEALDGSFSATLTAPRDSAIIDDESLIPEEYLETKKTPKKTDIARAIKAGKKVPGAHLEYNSGLRLG